MMRRPLLAVAVAACAVLAACSESTGPEFSGVAVGRTELTVAGEDPHILQQSATAPPLETYEKSVRVCYDESSVLEIHYVGDHEGDDHDDDDDDDEHHRTSFLRLWVPSEGLWKHPDGTSFKKDDCVLITVSIDPEWLVAEFQPQGLQFDPDKPARLTFSYKAANPDFDGDGYVGPSDEYIEWEKLDVFRLPHDGGAWEQTFSLHHVGNKQFKARLYSFSHYAVAH